MALNLAVYELCTLFFKFPRGRHHSEDRKMGRDSQFQSAVSHRFTHFRNAHTAKPIEVIQSPSGSAVRVLGMGLPAIAAAILGEKLSFSRPGG